MSPWTSMSVRCDRDGNCNSICNIRLCDCLDEESLMLTSIDQLSTLWIPTNVWIIPQYAMRRRCSKVSEEKGTYQVITHKSWNRLKIKISKIKFLNKDAIIYSNFKSRLWGRMKSLLAQYECNVSIQIVKILTKWQRKRNSYGVQFRTI